MSTKPTYSHEQSGANENAQLQYCYRLNKLKIYKSYVGKKLHWGKKKKPIEPLARPALIFFFPPFPTTTLPRVPHVYKWRWFGIVFVFIVGKRWQSPPARAISTSGIASSVSEGGGKGSPPKDASEEALRGTQKGRPSAGPSTDAKRDATGARRASGKRGSSAKSLLD